jgi:phosphoribosyl-AMP cyclohydrolase
MPDSSLDEILSIVKFDANGLVPAIVQDHESGDVLMFAWMNRESLAITIEKRQACYWSRSRKELWLKGATSGHTQTVHELWIDCDQDCILIRVTQVGGACHTGNRSCFYRNLNFDDDSGLRWRESGQVVFDSAKVYGGS